MPPAAISLDDRYAQRHGPVLISGVQALVRLMLVQADRNRAAGLRTGGFVSVIEVHHWERWIWRSAPRRA
jgi:indolepyruvate ferredoxin oxidoreductase